MISSWPPGGQADDGTEIGGKGAGSEGKTAAFGGKTAGFWGKPIEGNARNSRRRNGFLRTDRGV